MTMWGRGWGVGGGVARIHHACAAIMHGFAISSIGKQGAMRSCFTYAHKSTATHYLRCNFIAHSSIEYHDYLKGNTESVERKKIMMKKERKKRKKAKTWLDL